MDKQNIKVGDIIEYISKDDPYLNNVIFKATSISDNTIKYEILVLKKEGPEYNNAYKDWGWYWGLLDSDYINCKRVKGSELKWYKVLYG